MFITIGAVLAGLYLLLKELVPWLEAQRTGAIYTRGYKRVKIEKAVDPDRFRSVGRQRVRDMGLGLIAIAFGVMWFIWPIVWIVLLAPFRPPV